MNAQYFDRARAAYRAGDFSAAAQMFLAAKEPNELAGEADHLRGNCLMKLGLYADAAKAYSEALEDHTYGKCGALLTNRGKALAAVGDLEGAAESFSNATKDATYATPYKAYLGLANALLKLDRVTDAGVAFRSAAIDGANPAPATALASLGDCFVKLGRPGDAVESYLTALEYVGPQDDTHAIEAGLGCAYAAAGRAADAVDAFNRATSDGIYQLTPEQEDEFNTARDTVAAQSSISQVQAPAAPVAASAAPVDPLDPMGTTGNFMPDPSDTGFFTMTESEMIQQDRHETKVRRKKRHTGLKVFLVIVLLLVIAAGGLGFAYTRGLGFPSQQDAVTKLFETVASGEDTDQYLSPNLSDDAKAIIINTVEGLQGATATVSDLQAGMTESDGIVNVELAQGGSLAFDAHFVRSANHIGWALETFTMNFDDTFADDGADAGSAVDDSTTTDTTVDDGSESTDDAAATAEDDSASDSEIDSTQDTADEA